MVDQARGGRLRWGLMHFLPTCAAGGASEPVASSVERSSKNTCLKEHKR
jgi:hypothetical protein